VISKSAKQDTQLEEGEMAHGSGTRPTFFRDDSSDAVEQPRAVYGFNQHEHTAILAPIVHNHALQQSA